MTGHSEEDEFAAALDSEAESEEEQEAGGMLLGNVVADRHGFQEPQAPPAMLHSAPGGLVQPPTFVFAGKGKQALDGRPLLLFDINGVLMQHRWNGTSHQHDLRPGVHHLLRLLPHFRLGVYSSATRPTIAKALSKLHHNLANFVEQRRRAAAEQAAADLAAQQAQQAGAAPALPTGKKKRRAALAAAAAGGAGAGDFDADGFPRRLPHILFEVVMARDHCQPASQESIEARGGRPWDTVKPLGRYFASLARVLLVDDSAHKADDGEGSNMLVTPCWHGAAHPLGRGDGALPLLVELLLERAAAGAAQDLRRCSAEISAALADAAARQLEAAQAAQQLSAEEAAAAAAVLQAAVAGSAAVAAAAAALEAQGEAEAATSPAAAAEPLAQMDQQQQRQQGAKRAREEDISAPASAGPEAGATAEAAEAADTTLPRMTKKQRRELKERQLAAQAAAARDVVLAAAAALGGGGGGAPGSDSGSSVLGATLAEINSYLNTSWEHLSLLLFNRTAKAGLTAACAAGLLQIKGSRAGKAGGRYARTAAGEAAAASEQYIAELDAYCRQLPDRAALLARLEACSQQQEPAEAAAEAGAAAAGVAAASGAPPAAAAGEAAAGEDALLEAGFFWEKPSSSASQKASASTPQEAAAPAPAPSTATADAPPPPPPAGAPADLSALQQAVLLHAVGLLQVRPGVSLEQAVDWVEAALRGAHPELPLHADGDADAAARKLRTRLQRLLRSHLLRAMEACQKEGVATVSRLGRGAPNAMVLFVPTPGAAQPPEAQVEAALQVLAGMLGGGAAQPQPAASPAKSAAESAGAAEAAAPQPASWPAAVPEANAVAASADGVVATTAAAIDEDAAVPMLLEVFEDRAPPPAAAPAAVQAAAVSAPAGGGEEEEAEAARKLQELDDAAAALQARLAEVRRRAGEEGLSGKALSQRVLCAEVAALTGRSDAELAAMGAKALRKLARQARGAAKRARDAAAGKRSAGAAAAALLDRLFPAAAGGDEAAWAAACAALSEAEREVLRGQGIDLEAYRREVATRGAAAGPAASLGDWLCAGGEGEGEEEGGSAEEVDGPPEGDAEGLEAAAGAQAAATLDAAVAAHGGHYLRSCDAAAAGAAGDEQPPWFWEQQQEQEQGARASLPTPPQQQQQQHAAWQPQEQQEQEQAAWQHQQYWQQLRQQQEQALWQAQAAAQRAAGPLSPLHHEVAALALQATPTPLEVAAVQGAVLAVQEAACSLWPEARTALFGSQATGLALPGSDLDIVVLGVGPTLANAATGFTPVQRKQLSELLEDLLDALLQRRLLAGRAQIIEARVPIIKCRLAVGDGLAADISMGAENGAQAVDFVRRQVLAVPPLRPLCLVIKAFLRERCANEVFTGGLSSYSVFNMVMAHLQLEGYQPGLANPSHEAAAQQQQRGRGGRAGRAPPPPLPADLQETLGFLHQLAAGALPAMSQAGGAQQQGEGKAPSADLGTLLWGFFDRFGNHFSYVKQAVSIRMGGVCLKLRQWKNPRRPWALAVEDPQEMGKDIGGGSTAIREIKESFAQAAEMLAEVCEDLDANDAAAAAPPPGAAGGGGGAPPQQRPGQGPLLGGVLNLEAAVGRGPEAIKARAAMEATAAAKSQALLHERIKAGVAVGRGFGGGAAPRPLKGKAASRATRAAAKAERRQRLAEANEAYLTGRRRGGGGEARQQQQQSPAAGRKPGSKRGRAVEAAWGNTRGQYKDVSDDGGWSLRKQKKGKAKKGAAAKGSAGKGAAGKGAAASAKKQKRAKAQGEGGGAKKRARKD